MKILIALAMMASVARADDRSAAEALFRAGEKAFETAQYAAAADAFELAYAKLPLAAIAFSTAQAQRLQYFIDNQPQRLRRAAELYHVYIDQQKTGGRVGDAVANLAQIEPLLRELVQTTAVVAAPKLTRLVVTSDVPEARATIDGESGPVPFVHEVAAGEHAITVEAKGYATQSRKAMALPNEMVPVEVQMVALPAMLAITGTRGARVVVDARYVGEVSLARLELPAGKHVVVVEARGHEPLVKDIELARGGALSFDASLQTTGQRRAVPWVLGAGGALAIATGVAALLAHSADSDASKKYGQLMMGGADPGVITAYNRDLEDRTSRLHATEILGAAAGVAIATGVLLYIFDVPTSGRF